MKSAGKMMTLFWTLFSFALAGAALVPLMSEASPPVDGQLGYIAMGDSIEVGVGATPGLGWVPQFNLFLGGIEHNLGVSGATVRDIQHNQLFPAISDIQTHLPDGVVVSWGGGGNNLLDFIQSPQAATCLRGNPSCLARLNALLNEVQQTVDLTLGGLRFFAGPDSMILVRTMYNPLLRTGCDPTGGPQAALATVVLEGGAGPLLEEGLNDRLRALADKHEANVIEIFDFDSLGFVPFRDIPDALIAGDCIHPNNAGYLVILDAAIDAL